MKVRNIEYMEHFEGPSWKVVGILVFAGLAAIVIGLAYPLFTLPSAPAPQLQQAGAVTLTATAGETVILKDSISTAGPSTVFDTLQAAAGSQSVVLEYKTYPGMGILVTKIGDRASGEGGAYWQYWVNGSYAQVAADKLQVKPGDSIEWKLTASNQ